MAGNLICIEPMMGFEPDSICIDDTYNCNRSSEKASGYCGHTIKRAIRRGIKDGISADGVYPQSLIWSQFTRAYGVWLGDRSQLSLQQGLGPLVQVRAIQRNVHTSSSSRCGRIALIGGLDDSRAKHGLTITQTCQDADLLVQADSRRCMLRAYIEHEKALTAQIEQAVIEADRGDFACDDQVAAAASGSSTERRRARVHS